MDLTCGLISTGIGIFFYFVCLIIVQINQQGCFVSQKLLLFFPYQRFNQSNIHHIFAKSTYVKNKIWQQWTRMGTMEKRYTLLQAHEKNFV